MQTWGHECQVCFDGSMSTGSEAGECLHHLAIFGMMKKSQTRVQSSAILIMMYGITFNCTLYMGRWSSGMILA